MQPLDSPPTPGSTSLYRHLRNVLAVGVLVALAALVFVDRTADAQTSTCAETTHQPDFDPEVLVGTTATRLPQLCGRRGVEIWNHGPNTIWCTVTGLSKWARVNKSRGIVPGDAWPVDGKDTNPIWCIAETAAQVTGAATILSEIR